MKNIFFIGLFSLATFCVAAQQQQTAAKKPTKIFKQDKRGTILYFTEQSGGIGLNTTGWSIFYNKTKVVHFTKKSFWEIEYSKIKHEKEVRTTPIYIQGGPVDPKSFVLGKINSLFAFEFRRGYNFKLSQKAIKNGIEVSVNTSLGLTLGLLKPYYLILRYPSATTDQVDYRYEKYSDANASTYLDTYGVYSYGGFWKGLFETKPVPGFNARLGMCFDWASYDDNISSLEVGLKVNSFITTVPIMARTTNHQVFPAFFVEYRIGGRK